MNKIIPIFEIAMREANHTEVLAAARARADIVSKRLEKEEYVMTRLVQHAFRAESITTKVNILRTLMNYVHAATLGQAACKSGCSSCCHVSVALFEPEARVIAKELKIKAQTPTKRMFLPEDRRAREKEHYGSPCPFLKDDKCSIYAIRPLSCRVLYNLDVDSLLCTIVEGEPLRVPYLDYRQYNDIIFQTFAADATTMADIREFFPKGRGK